VLDAVVRLLEPFLAASAQAPAVPMVSELKVATPATAVAVTVPPRVHEDEIVIESVEPVPVVITLP
jgi:hypothetical protein